VRAVEGGQPPVPPRVILHNSISVDGRVDFPLDMGLHYGVLQGLSFQAHLTGSGTILAAPLEGPDDAPEDTVPGETGGEEPGAWEAGSVLVAGRLLSAPLPRLPPLLEPEHQGEDDHPDPRPHGVHRQAGRLPAGPGPRSLLASGRTSSRGCRDRCSCPMQVPMSQRDDLVR